MTTNTREVSDWIGREVVGRDGDKIGKIEAVYVDEQTGRPEWVGVKTGLFGTRLNFVPLASASTKDDAVSVPYAKEKVKDAPQVDAEETVSEEEEARLYRHYGLEYSESRSDSGLPEGSADDAMTVSEEELRVGTTTREAGRARLRKWVETEQVTQTVPVAHEEVRIQREPITEGNVDTATSGPDFTEDTHEVGLMEEEVVVAKQTVPKERVRLEKDTVTEEAEVGAELRKERVEAEVEPPQRG